MDDLVCRKYALDALGIFNDRENGNEHFLNGIETAKEIVANQDSVEAVPLEPLCKILAKYYHAPCNYRDDICETDENGDCPGIAKPDEVCWQHIIKKWMEGEDEQP